MECVVFFRMTPVQPRQRLHSFNVIKDLIYIHCMQQQFIETRLEHICNNQDTIWILLERFRDLRICKAVHHG